MAHSARRMAGRLMRRRRMPPGTAPGTLSPAPDAAPSTLQAIGYGPEGADERAPADLDAVAELRRRWPVVWVNVDGLGTVEVLRRLADMFGLHSLALEDVLSPHQRPKVEPYGEHLFIVMQMVGHRRPFEPEQLSLFVGPGFIVSLQERAGDCFDPVRQRIRRGLGRLRSSGPDYLAYALLDAAIDDYFPVLEEFGETVEALEKRAIDHPTDSIVAEVHELKRDLMLVRRALWPQREMLQALLRDELPPVGPQTQIYLRDCYDHLVQLLDTTEIYREVAGSLFDLYMLAVSNRMNEIMKVLTVIATIFIPLSFIASVYGMNFDPDVSPWNMPELRWAYGYPFALGLMAAVAAGFLVIFRRKGWLNRAPPARRR